MSTDRRPTADPFASPAGVPAARAGEPTAAPDPANLVCPAPIPERARVLLGHGSGGQLSAALMREVIGPALAAAAPGGPLTTPQWWKSPASGWPSRPIPSWSARSSSPVAISVSLP